MSNQRRSSENDGPYSKLSPKIRVLAIIMTVLMILALIAGIVLPLIDNGPTTTTVP